MKERFSLTISTGDAAFSDGAEAEVEVARLLREVADRIEAGEVPPFSIRDYNGNTVGGVR